MTVSVVKHGAASYSATTHSSLTATWDGGGTATVGHALALIASCEQVVPGKRVVLPAGWTEIYRPVPDIVIARKVSDGTETGVTITFEDFSSGPVSDNNACLAIVEVSGAYDSIGTSIGSGGNPHTLPSVAPPSGLQALLVWLEFNVPIYLVTSAPSGYTNLDDVTGAGRVQSWWKNVATTSGSYSGSVDYGGAIDFVYGHLAFIDATPTAAFTYDLGDGFEPQTVAFTDTSDPKAGTITDWAWDFGDGGTSTSQNPSHLYAHGSFTVTLTITVAGVDYTVSHTVTILVDVDYTPPLPGLALVEIYATSPGSARWDLANWDEAVWSSDSWQNVTPESTDVTIVWGSQRPELGILSTPDAASWGIGFFDPQRLLDPANPNSPFFGDIVPGLPVRVTHRGFVVKQGILESAGHNFDLNSFQSHNSGYFRVTDSQSLMARSKVPSDTTLGDDLFSRARDAIAAAGLTIRVVPEGFASSPLGDVLPIGHVHDLVPWVTGTDWSVWQWISDAAAQVLHVPYINRPGELGFRQWGLPKDNAKSLRSPNLVGLGSVIFQNGTYSVINALDDDGVTLRTAEVTPKPYYGAVTYDDRATKPTPNAQDWADAVLADRAVAGLRWVPGEVFPLTANDVRYFAEIEAIERVSIDYVEANPPISATGIVVGGQIVITPVQEREARWSFLFQVAATEDQPLVDDDAPASFLVNDDDPTDYLYPG